jgi:aerobic carbon-monoxide dehydrogenase small subunit
VTAHTVHLTVNGSPREMSVEARKSLADALREDLGLTGTHLGCEQGVCGACTVILDGQPVRSCILFAVQADGHDIRTIEGVAPDGELHPVQQAFSDYHGLQCGFCTPGMILATVDLLDRTPRPSVDEIKEALGGNLCRCTGYTKIIESVEAAAAAMASEGGR